MDIKERRRLASDAQDAYHYLLAALCDDESAFVNHNFRDLRRRIENFENGCRKLEEIMDWVWPMLPNGTQHASMPPWLAGRHWNEDIEDIKDLEKMARRGIALIRGICRRYEVSARYGETRETVEGWKAGLNWR